MIAAVQTKAPLTPASAFTHTPSTVLQRKCACGGTPGPSGKCEDCRKKYLTSQENNVQTKLAMSQPSDRWEQEADRIATAIASRSDSRTKVAHKPSRGAPPQAEPLAMRQAGSLPAVVQAALQSPGAPLDLQARSLMEEHFGYDFSQVRIHTDPQAAESASRANALAYTVGKDVVFGGGQYAPHTPAGQKLLAHELTHVVQQNTTGPRHASLRREISTLSEAGEQPVTPPAAHSLRLILPDGEVFIGPPEVEAPAGAATPAEPAPAEVQAEGSQSTAAETPQPREESGPQLQRMVAVNNRYTEAGAFIQRSATFTNPTPVAQDPLARLATGDPPGLTTPTINGQVITNLQAIQTQITPTQVAQTGTSGGQTTCQVDRSFTINTSANMIVASNAGPTGWTGNLPLSVLGNPATCAGRQQVPATMNAQPNNADFVTRVRSDEGEHATELQALHNRHFVPYERFVMGLTGTGANLAAAGQNLVGQLGQRPLQAALGFLLGNQAQVRRLDGPGGSHSDNAVPTFAASCASVAITLSLATPRIPGSAAGNVVTVAPTVTNITPAGLTVVGTDVMQGSTILKHFTTTANANRALQVIQHYGMTSRNVIGNMEFFLVGTNAPSGAFAGASELAIDPAFYQVSFGVPGASDWAITQVIGNNINVLVNFGNARNEAFSALAVMTRLGFTSLCWVGGTRQAPEMLYFRT